MKRWNLVWAVGALGPPAAVVWLLTRPGVLPGTGVIEGIWVDYRPYLLFLPGVLFLANGVVNLIVRSSRLACMSGLFMLAYLYLVVPWAGIGLRPDAGLGLVLRESHPYLTLLIPLSVLVIHFQPDRSLVGTRRWGTLGLIGGQFALLAGVYAAVPEGANRLYEGLFMVSLPGIRVEFAWATGLLLAFTAVVFHYPDRTSFYHLRNTILFWVMVTVMLGFYPEFQRYNGAGVPLHHLLLFGTGSLMMVPKTLHSLRLKIYHDPLTLLPARLALEERLSTLPARYALALVEVDRFKELNDTYGSDAGGTVLCRVAETLERTSSGEVYRFEGQQFALMYPDRKVDELETELEEIQRNVRNLSLQVTKKSKRATKLYDPTITVSLGVAGREPEDGAGPEEVLEEADRALDRARQAGRDQLTLTP